MDAKSLIYLLVEGLIGVASAVGNAFVLYIICKHKSLRNVTNYLIVSLATADMLVGVVGIPCVMVNSFGLPHEFYSCLFMNCVIIILTQISIFNLMAIAIERFAAIQFPFRHRQHIDSQIVAVAIAIAWVAGTVVGMVPMFGWHAEKPPDGVAFVCSFTAVIDMGYMVYFNFFGCVLTPLIIIFITYGQIFRVIRQRRKVLPKNLTETVDPATLTAQTKMATESKSAKKIFNIIILFAVCWLPIHILNCITLFAGKTNLPSVLVGVVLSHLNSAINPFVYVHTNSKIKAAVRKTLRCRSGSSNAVDQTQTNTAQ